MDEEKVERGRSRSRAPSGEVARAGRAPSRVAEKRKREEEDEEGDNDEYLDQRNDRRVYWYPNSIIDVTRLDEITEQEWDEVGEYTVALNPPPSLGGLLVGFGLRLLADVPKSVWLAEGRRP